MAGARRRFAMVLAVGVVTASFGLLVESGARRAEAACHIAAFRQDAVTVGEGAGEAVLRVFLQGEQPQCSGAVRYETVDGTARAPDDYTSRSGVLCFVANQAREQEIAIPIVDDGLDEPDEQFTVRLQDTEDAACVPDSISANATATVTIGDDDAPPPAAPPPDPAPTQAAPQPVATATPSPAPTPTPDEPSPPPTPTPTTTPLAVEDTTEGAGGRGALYGLALAVALLAIGGAVFAWRRTGGAPT